MAISLRLGSELERRLNRYADATGTTKSQVVRELVAEYLGEKDTMPSAWDLGKNLFGCAGSGRPDLSTNRKKILKEKLREKKSSR